jgi:hypothetical protein
MGGPRFPALEGVSCTRAEREGGAMAATEGRRSSLAALLRAAGFHGKMVWVAARHGQQREENLLVAAVVCVPELGGGRRCAMVICCCAMGEGESSQLAARHGQQREEEDRLEQHVG